MVIYLKKLYGTFEKDQGYFGDGYYFFSEDSENAFKFKEYEFFEFKELKILKLDSFSPEWVDLISKNDKYNYILDFDVVIGPRVTKNSKYFLEEFWLGTFGKDDLIRMLSYSEVQLQYFFKDKGTAEKCLKEIRQ